MAQDDKDEQKTSETLTPPSHRIFDSSGMLRKVSAQVPLEPSNRKWSSAPTADYP